MKPRHHDIRCAVVVVFAVVVVLMSLALLIQGATCTQPKTALTLHHHNSAPHTAASATTAQMTAVAQLSADLSSLITEARRRSPEIKHAAERSLATLRTYSAPQDETEFLRGVSQSSDFVTPFLLSCSSRNAKFSSIAIQSLQRLIQCHAVPLSRLDMLLEALTESTRLAVDIQLKVLQILPLLFQTYAEFIGGALLAKLLLICAMLQQPSKLPMVINTAAATQQQLVLALFEKIVDEDSANARDRDVFEVAIDEGDKLEIPSNAYDAFRVLSDICSLIEHQAPSFLTFNVLSESFGLELLENIVTSYRAVFLSHRELGFIVRTRITPLLLRLFSGHKDFHIVVRVSRIISLLIKSQLSILEIEAEVILSLLTHAITFESNLPQWKKALSLEMFLKICENFELTKEIFQTYDYASDKKKIITEFFSVCSAIINEQWAQQLLNVNDIVAVPSPDEAISTHNSSMKIPLCEILDKHEPPAIPKTYTLFLIHGCTTLLSEGIGKSVLGMTAVEGSTTKFLTDEELKSEDVKLLKTLVSANAKSLVTISTEFLYASLSPELFYSLTRALQRLCNASGFIGLMKERDSLLMMFSIATVSNVTKRPDLRNSSISETFVDTVSGAFSAATTPSTPSKKVSFQQRQLNSRHVICFRALSSLTASLGPLLGHSWRFILITLQWFDYFLNGPSSYLSFKEVPQKPNLPAQDLKTINQCLSRFIESTQNYDTQAYRVLMSEMIALATETTSEENESSEPIDEDEFKVCPHTKDYYLYRLRDLSKANSFRYLQKENSTDWSTMSTFLSNVATSEQVIEDLRVTSCTVFNEIIMSVANGGFSSSSSAAQKSDLEIMLFKSFSEVMDKMLDSHSGQSFNSAESGIVHDTLKNLYELLNRFGPELENSWGTILHIIGSPFKVMDQFKHPASQKQLLKSAFEILQLILNDFLHSIPLSSLRDVIDVLENFCSQTFELNVSFSGVSYYWLISDHLRELASSEPNTVEFDVKSAEDLSQLIDSTGSTFVKVHALWLYLLKSLVHISNISRAEVKNGGVQTFFRIMESHGSYLNWERAFPVVVQNLLSIDLEKPASNDFEDMKAFVDVNTIILRGITDLFTRFYILSNNSSYWEALLNCYKRYASLDVTPLSLITFKSFNQILSQLKITTPVQNDLFFKFWSSQPLKYVAVDTDLYQDSLIEYVGTFEKLHKFSPVSSNKLETTLGILNNLVRFPFLPKYTSDVSNPTKLQTAILECLESFDTANEGDVVLSQISSMALMPFQIRSRILKKLHAINKKEVPSFIAVSARTLDLLDRKLRAITDFRPLISDGSIIKVMKNLIETITSSSDDDDHEARIVGAGIWRKSFEVLLFITTKVSPLLSNYSDNLDEGLLNGSEVWSLIIDAACLTLPESNFERDEQFNSKNYETLRDIIIENLSQKGMRPTDLLRFVSAIWRSSILYSNNDLDYYLLENSQGPEEITRSLIAFKVEDYTTSPIHVLSQPGLRQQCLNDLFTLSKPPSDDKLLSLTLPYLLCRVVMIIKKFSGSQRLLNKAPVPTIQQKELQLLLNRLYQLLKLMDTSTFQTYQPLLSVFPLILDNHHYIGKLKHSQGLLNGITAEFYKISSK